MRDSLRELARGLARLLHADFLAYFAGGIGGVGNNHPLRGHKHDPWEGGTRVTAFIVGGLIPAHLQGSNSGAKLVIIADWYVTFLKLAGADPTDDVFFADNEGGGSVHGVDGVDV